MEKQLIKGKRLARKLALQALYQWSMSGHELVEIETQFRCANKLDKADNDYFCHLLKGVPRHLAHLEESFLPYLDRPINSLNPVELALLRIGAFELHYCLEIPYRVILDEAVSLAKEFGSQDGFRYVNGVLNNLARQVRTVEINNE